MIFKNVIGCISRDTVMNCYYQRAEDGFSDPWTKRF